MAVRIPAGIYCNVHDFARMSELSEQTVKRAAKEGRIAGAVLFYVTYLIPVNAVITSKAKSKHGRDAGQVDGITLQRRG